MSEKRILALLGLLLGLIAGVLLLVGAVQGARQSITLDFLLQRAVIAVLGLAILFGSLLIYRGKHKSGGLVNLVLGLVVLVLSYGTTTEAVLAVISGVLGLVAEQAKG